MPAEPLGAGQRPTPPRLQPHRHGAEGTRAPPWRMGGVGQGCDGRYRRSGSQCPTGLTPAHAVADRPTSRDPNGGPSATSWCARAACPRSSPRRLPSRPPRPSIGISRSSAVTSTWDRCDAAGSWPRSASTYASRLANRARSMISHGGRASAPRSIGWAASTRSSPPTSCRSLIAAADADGGCRADRFGGAHRWGCRSHAPAPTGRPCRRGDDVTRMRSHLPAHQRHAIELDSGRPQIRI